MRIGHLLRPELIMASVVDGEDFLPQLEGDRKRSKDSQEAYLRLHAAGAMEQLGRIMALDIMTNNWDRLPCGAKAWNFEYLESNHGLQWYGNADNMMLTADGRIHAIDSEFKTFFPICCNNPEGINEQQARELYLLQLREVFSSLHHALKTSHLSATAQAVRTFLVATRQVEVKHEALLRFQQAVGEGLDVLLGMRDDFDGMHGKALERVGLGDSGSSAEAGARKQRTPEIALAVAVIDLWAETRAA
eukprot:TRINITY_DN6690_c0_g1_i1.p1 TRINITY_DN6690_c0_g1~~TRINITY_DN6690_c0_g1_i1.p1  ORF type:complete len:247 (-),score=52.78 TRINITY_DN6690_c0_g1_i1:525-1265(-)